MAEAFFDTNILIDWLADRPEARAELNAYSRHVISRIVWTELLAGEPPERRGIVQEALQAFDIVEVDAAIALAAVDIRYRSRIKLLDALILATARVHGGMLVTRNTKDFPATMAGVRIPYLL